MAKIDILKISREIKDKSTILNNAFVQVARKNTKDKIEVEIGDTKDSSTFYPQQKIMRWDNEVNCSIRLIHDEKNPEVKTKKDKIVWEGDKIKAEIYQLTEGEGGQEFEITLKEKPKSNIIQFTLVDKCVDYFYQPELTLEEKIRGVERPENIVGSYAIYSSEEKINYIGGKEYKSGKVGHIYRPKIIDSEGTEVWGDLHIENGILSVTIPQEFLNKAVYPVKHAAGLTFGYTTAGASDMLAENGEIRRSGDLISPSDNGTTSRMDIYLRSTDGNSHSVQLGLYNNTSLIGNTSSISYSSTSASWVNSSLSVNIYSSISYGLAWQPNAGFPGLRVYFDASTSKTYNYLGTFGTWPNPISWTNTYSSQKYSLYVTYTKSEVINTTNFFQLF